MLKTLIKKQFFEAYKSFFVDPKTNKTRSKSSTRFKIITYVLLMLFLAGCFISLAYLLSPILETQIKWLYYSIIAIMSFSLSVFASIFYCRSALYLAKDNDLLLSMPINPKDILLSRISMVLFLNAQYSALVWIPGMVMAIILKQSSLIEIIFQLVLWTLITLLSSVISCLVGYIVSLVTIKTNNKKYITTIISLLFFGLYYLLCFNLDELLTDLVNQAQAIGSNIITWANFIYQIGSAAIGNILSLLLFIGIDAILCIICFKVLSKSFTKIAISNTNEKASTNKLTYKASKDIKTTIFKKEFKRFISSTTYVLNAGIGALFVIVIAIGAILKSSDFTALISLAKEYSPALLSYIPLVLFGVVSLVVGMDLTSCHSISLEGNNLWILKSLPIDSYDIIEAKAKLQILINGIPGIIAALIIGFAFRLEITNIIDSIALILLNVYVQSYLGIIIDLNNPNLFWSNETQVIKQGTSTLVCMFINLVFVGLTIFGYYLASKIMDINEYLYYVIVLYMVLTVLLRRYLRSKGTTKFNLL